MNRRRVTAAAAAVTLLLAAGCTQSRRADPPPVAASPVDDVAGVAAGFAVRLHTAPARGPAEVDAVLDALADPASAELARWRSDLRAGAAAVAGRVRQVWVSPLAVATTDAGPTWRVHVWLAVVVDVSEDAAKHLAAEFVTDVLTLRRAAEGWRLVGYTTSTGPTPALFEPPTAIADARATVPVQRGAAVQR